MQKKHETIGGETKHQALLDIGFKVEMTYFQKKKKLQLSRIV